MAESLARDRSTRDNGIGRWGPWVLSAVTLAVSGICQWTIGFNNDNAWLLYVGTRVLDGARLYVDLIEINPPLIVWLNVAVAWIARMTGANPVTVFRALVFSGALASALTCEWLAGRATTRMRSGVVFGVLSLVLLALPVGSFGQREHLMLILLSPYLFLSAARQAQWKPAVGLAASVGLCAGIGIALKPQFAGIWLLVVWWTTRRPNSRLPLPEQIAVVVVGLGYLTGVLAGVPEYVQLVGRLGRLYAAYRPEALYTLVFGHFEVLGSLVALGLHLAYRSPRISPLADVLALALAGALLGAVLQGKGFEYHYYPALALAVALASVHAVSAQGRRAHASTAIALAVVLTIPYILADIRIGFGRGHGEMATYRALERTVRPVRGESLLVLAPRSGYAFGLVTYARMRWVGRFPCLWAPPLFYPSSGPVAFHADRELSPLERDLRDQVVSDAIRGKPDVILVGLPRVDGPADYRFDFLAYLRRDPRFMRFFEQYQREGEQSGYAIYRKREA